MPKQANHELAFQLTPFEEKLLAFSRSGMSARQIAEAVGYTATNRGRNGGLGGQMSAAIEKDRLRILHAADKYRPGAQTTLRQARNANHPTVELRQGRWKTGD